MRINWCVISFKFNFLAEATIKTLPPNPDGDIFLIHCGKEKNYSDAFNDNGRLAGIFFVPGERCHGDNLDGILKYRQYPQVVNCDWLVMIDHDIHINEPESFRRVIRENTSPEDLRQYAIIACENNWNIEGTGFKRHFLTTPLMIINMHHDWESAESWTYTQGQDWYFDTGQFVAETLGNERIKCYEPFAGNAMYHFSSAWQWMLSRVKTLDINLFESAVLNIKKGLVEGAFLPSFEEVAMMKKYFLLREALAQLEAEGFKAASQDDNDLST